MKYGCLRVRALSCRLTPGDPDRNAEGILSALRENESAHITLFPELSLTGYTAGDLFGRRALLSGAINALMRVATEAKGLVFVGLPAEAGGRVYDCMAALANGRVLGVVPKARIARGASGMDARWFADGESAPVSQIEIGGEHVPFGAHLCFEEAFSGVRARILFGSELRAGTAFTEADIVLCPDAEPVTMDADDWTRDIARAESKRALCVVVYANAGEGESTAEGVYPGDAFVYAGGERIEDEVADIERLRSARLSQCIGRRENTAPIRFSLNWTLEETLPKAVAKNPFLYPNADTRLARVVPIQARALSGRLQSAGMRKLIVGVSGGLDSTLALIAAREALMLLGLPERNLIAVTMPGYGTGARTRGNAEKLIALLGAEMREIPITDACDAHLRDIGHETGKTDVTYENAQARERTQILMDLANQEGALVVGTGDLSELALGFCTYGGDHMSMYGVNASVPKTVVRETVRYWGRTHPALTDVLFDIADTPISPELTPADERGEIRQKTEEIVGKYELNDFFLYHFLANGFSGEKITRLASIAFADSYDGAAIESALSKFEKRFFTQQFKRSCAPDAPKISPISFSPRGGFMLPSDVKGRL